MADTAGQMEYASKQLLCAVHMRGGPALPGGLLVSLEEMTSRYWSQSAAGEQVSWWSCVFSLSLTLNLKPFEGRVC